MSIEPEKIPAILHTHTPRLVADLRRTIGDLVPLDQHEGLVEETVRSIYQSGRPIDADAQQEADWLSEQVQQRVLESLLSKPYPPAFSAESERLLAALLRLRRPEAWELLVKYAPSVDAYLARTYPLFSEEERQDIVGDALVRVFEKGNDFDPELSSIRTWLTKHVIYRARDELRLYISPSGIDHLADSLEDTHDTSAKHTDEQPSAAMDELIRKLPAKRAQALRMHYYEGRSFAEIAREMNTSEVTVRSTLSRARKDLERLIGDNITFVRRVVPVVLALMIAITSQAIDSGKKDTWDMVRWFTGIAEAPSSAPHRVFIPTLRIHPSLPSAHPLGSPTAWQPSATIVPTNSPMPTPMGSLTAVSSAPRATQGKPPTLQPTMAATLVPATSVIAPSATRKPTSSPTVRVAPQHPTRVSGVPSQQPTTRTNVHHEPQSASATAITATVTGIASVTPIASTSGPTVAPSALPTATPSATPEAPTSSPTVVPSATATPTPSVTPTASAIANVPTSSPTVAPSATAIPSVTPEELAPCAVYGIHDAGNSTTQLVTIDLNTRTARATVPAWQHADIRDIAFRPGTNELYAVSGDEGARPGTLFRSDVTTGALTLIGSSGFSVISAIAFHPADGSLWAWIEAKGLARIDLANGAATLVYRSSVEIDGLAWSVDGTRLYGAYERTLWVYENGRLQREATNLPGLTQAIGWDSAGHLIGTYHQNSAFTLFTYDLATQHVRDEVQIASDYEDIDALAWTTSCGVPDP